MAKYPISKEFFPFSMFAPPMSRSFVLLAQKGMAGGERSAGRARSGYGMRMAYSGIKQSE